MQCGSPLPGDIPEKTTAPKAGAGGDPREIVFQARQVSLDKDSFGNWIITGDNNTITLSPDEAPAAHLRLYYRSLAEDCRQLPLGLVNEEFIRPGVERSLSLTSVYTDLDVASGLLSEVKGKRSARWFGMRLEQGEGGERTALLKAISQPEARCVVLVGAPGSGKSTFVNYLAARLAGGESKGLPERIALPLAVRLELRRASLHIAPEAECGTPEMLWNALRDDIGRFWGADSASLLLPYLQRRLALEGGLVLLDGLDEVPEAGSRRKCLLEAVQAWVKLLPRCRFLLTGRPYAYADPKWRLAGFETLALAPFNPQQVESFVQRWYQAVRHSQGWDEQMAAERAGDLLANLKTRPDLGDLTTRPLLLTLLATLHSHKSHMPEDRADLYEFSVGLLLQRWQVNRQVKDQQGNWVVEPGILQVLELGEARLREAIEALALKVHTRQRQSPEGRTEAAEKAPVDISLGEVLEVFSQQAPGNINALELVRYFEERAGLLVGREENVYTFLHRSFQEYLAASRLANSEPDLAEKLRQLVSEDMDWWREVFLLAVGKRRLGGLSSALDILNRLVHAAAQEMEKISEFDWRLAVLCGQAAHDLRLKERAGGNAYAGSLLKRLRGWLRALLEGGQLSLPERLQAGDLLGLLGDPRPGVGIRSTPAGDIPGIAWAHVPQGEFRMGSSKKDKDAYKDEFPQHPLTLAEFWISRCPLTNAQYAPFVTEGYDQERFWSPEGWAWLNGAEPDFSPVETFQDDTLIKIYKEQVLGRKNRYQPTRWKDPKWGSPSRPLVGVCWYEAAAYCRWLDERLRQEGLWPQEVPAEYRARLPSEAEWEKAGRGTDGRIYPWGDGWQEGRANTEEAKLGETSPVGLFGVKDQPYGLFDMAGNTFEWTLSKWGMNASDPDYGYPYNPDDGRHSAAGPDWRVVRGGSWFFNQGNARCASRDRNFPSFFNHYLGFRVVLSLALPGF
jgi:formylglycine-generating enzyme required for sulfatase activity